MQIKDLLAPWFHYQGNEQFNELTIDSRKVEAGDIFVAIPGHQVDGSRFVEQALQSGAIAALIHTDDAERHGQVEYCGLGIRIHFFHLAKQLSAIAIQRYPVNGSTMKIIGVTGTNGKTTVTQLIAQLSQFCGVKAAVMGTTGNGLWGELTDTGNTTADAITVIKQLHGFQMQGAEICAMEVSSHGLVQHRVDAVPFSTAVMTNLSRDHLDYHGDMKSYSAAKLNLFKFPSLKHGLINLDDKVADEWRTQLKPELMLGFSIQTDNAGDFTASNVEYNSQGVTALLEWPEGRAKLVSPLLGAFNLSNLLAALSALHLQGFDMQTLISQARQLQPASGRMELYQVNGINLVVDYAHTPDAITQALTALRQHCKNDLWCVFGCGGDRDKGKRSLMAKAAEATADKVIITSDNPRTESPESIINDVMQGFDNKNDVLIEPLRQQAIDLAFYSAQEGDVILLAGKGHETYQEINGIKHDYDEREIVKALVAANKETEQTRDNLC